MIWCKWFNILNKIDALSISSIVKNVALKNKFIDSKIWKPILNLFHLTLYTIFCFIWY